MIYGVWEISNGEGNIKAIRAGYVLVNLISGLLIFPASVPCPRTCESIVRKKTASDYYYLLSVYDLQFYKTPEVGSVCKCTRFMVSGDQD